MNDLKMKFSIFNFSLQVKQKFTNNFMVLNNEL